MSNIMTLEDFFTLVEMKEGLTVTARVEELVAAMKKEQDCLANNAGDAMRQWSNVANVIALTDNKDCLDLFIQLGGLLFVDRWLKDAQTFSADADYCFVEDSILASLQALEKLQIDDDKLTSSGICLTVRDLLSHKNIKIHDKAKEFLGNLKPPNVSGTLKKLDPKEPDEAQPVQSVTHISSSFTRSDQDADIDQHMHLLVGDNVASPGCGVNKDSEGVESVVKESDSLISRFSDFDLKVVNDSGECFVREKARPSEQISTSELSDTEQKSGGTWTSPDDRGALINCKSMLAQKTPSRGDETSCSASQDSPVDGRKSEDLDNTYSQTDNESLSNESVEPVKYDPSHFRDSRGFEPSRDCRSIDVTSKTSAMDLENGMFDALEVACLVAKEVEMQVNEDDEEHFGTFTKKSSTVEPLHNHASAPDSLNCEKDQQADGSSLNEAPVEKASDADSSVEDEPSMSSDNGDAEQVNCLNVAESSKVTDKGTSEIDLNFEICPEDASKVTEKVNADNSVSKPVSVTSVSKALSAPGWKGSATSSAFQPASPHKTNADSTDPSRHGQDFVFDLNFSEDGGSVPSVEALVKPSSRSSEKLSFDLNLKSEDRDAPLSPCPKPSMRDFDLNDKPVSDLGSTTSSHQLNSYKEPFDDSVVSIMGAKVKKNTPIQQAPIPFLSGGRVPVARSGPHLLHYPPSFYSYKGIVSPPISFSRPVYYEQCGTPAYMMDSRGVPLVPQLMSASPFAHRPAFTPNMMVQLTGPNRVNSFRPHVSFNPGFVVEGNNRINAGGFRQFSPAQWRPAHVQPQQQQQPLFQGIVGGKRKEPDGRWEVYQQPPPPPPPPYL